MDPNWTQVFSPDSERLTLNVSKVFRHEIGTALTGEKSLREILGAISEPKGKSSRADGGQLELVQFLLTKAFVGLSFPQRAGVVRRSQPPGGLLVSLTGRSGCAQELAKQLCKFFHLDSTLAAGGKCVMHTSCAR